MKTQEEIDAVEYLNAGCGNTKYKNCINMDISDNIFTDVDIVGSVLDIPFPAERFKGVIFSHVLEHLHRKEHKWAFFQIWKVLKPNGSVYVECPDFEVSVKYWLENKKGMRDFWYHSIYGRDAYAGDAHKSGVTRQYLTDILFEMGFAHLLWIGHEPQTISVVAKKASMPEVKI